MLVEPSHQPTAWKSPTYSLRHHDSLHISKSGHTVTPMLVEPSPQLTTCSLRHHDSLPGVVRLLVHPDLFLTDEIHPRWFLKKFILMIRIGGRWACHFGVLQFGVNKIGKYLRLWTSVINVVRKCRKSRFLALVQQLKLSFLKKIKGCKSFLLGK